MPAAKSRIVLVDRPKSPQSVISAGEILDAKGRDDLVTLQAANEIFGGSFLSRINTNLRETKGWSYGVRSQVFEYLESAPFNIRAPVQADRTGDSIKELLADMKAFLGDKGVTAAELERTVNGNVRELPGSFETSGAVLGGVLEHRQFLAAGRLLRKARGQIYGDDGGRDRRGGTGKARSVEAVVRDRGRCVGGQAAARSTGHGRRGDRGAGVEIAVASSAGGCARAQCRYRVP